MLMSYGASIAPIPFPAGATAVYDPRYNPSILNAANAPASLGEPIATIQDLSGNNRHATQASTVAMPLYMQFTGRKYLFKSTTITTVPYITYFAGMNIANDVGIQTEIQPASWNSGSYQVIAARRGGVAQQSWILYINNTDGRLLFQWFVGGVLNQALSTVATGFANYVKKHVRVRFRNNTGAGQYGLEFYTSDDGIVWTQLGTTVTGTATAGVDSSTSNIEFFGFSSGSGAGNAAIYNFKLFNGGFATAPIVNWNADAATAWELTGTESATGAVVQYSFCPLVGNACFLANGSTVMPIANPFTMPGDYRYGTWAAFQIASGSTIQGMSTSNSIAPYGLYIDSSGALYSNSNVTQYNYTLSTISPRKNTWVASAIGGTGTLSKNGSINSPIGTGASGSATTVNQLFVRGANTSIGVIGPMGMWLTTPPSVADIETWLNYYEDDDDISIEGMSSFVIAQEPALDQVDISIEGMSSYVVAQEPALDQVDISIEGMQAWVIANL